MISGLGISEILFIGLIILIFFGSEDLPRLLRQVGEQWRKIKDFTNKAKAEIDAAVKDVTPDLQGAIDDSTHQERSAIRNEVKTLMQRFDETERENESTLITEQIIASDAWKTASSVLLFVSLRDEPDTTKLMQTALNENKRVVLPYCKEGSGTIGVAEITNPENDLVPGSFGTLEPRKELQDNFFLSDIRLILCPGVAFSRDGYRLGREKGEYDSFLNSLVGKVPIWGTCFSTQFREYPLPFDYNDVKVNRIVTPIESISIG